MDKADSSNHHLKSDKKHKIHRLYKTQNKKFVAILMVITFAGVGAILFMVSRAAGNATMSLSPSSSSPTLGNTLVVTIQENSGTDLINAVQADLTYDQTKLQCVSVDTTVGPFDGMVVKKTCANGVINISAATSSAVSGTQSIAKVTFNTIGVGTAAVNFASTSAIIRASDTVNVYGAPTNGSYTIADKTAPTTPSGLNVTASSSNSITLGWTASSDNVGVTGYKIYRNGTQVNTSTTNSYTDTGLSVGTGYSYTVAAYDAAGNTSSQSSSVSFTIADKTAPTVPTGLALVSKTADSITISWSASTDNVGVIGYKVYRGGTQVGNTASATFTDSGLSPNASYSYTIAAYDAASNNSAQSTASSFKTDYKAGDINGDGAVSVFDLSVLATNFEKSNMTREQGDLDGNGTVNIFDLSILARYWGT